MVSTHYSGDTDHRGTTLSAARLSVAHDATTTMVSELPTSVTYGDESASLSSVTVNTHYGEAVPNRETGKLEPALQRAPPRTSAARGPAK